MEPKFATSRFVNCELSPWPLDGVAIYGHAATGEALERTRDYFRRCVGALLVERDRGLTVDRFGEWETLLKALNGVSSSGIVGNHENGFVELAVEPIH